MTQLHAAIDGTVCGVNSPGYAYYLAARSSNWVTMPMPPTGGTWKYATCSSQGNLFAAIDTNSRSIWTYISGAWTKTTGVADIVDIDDNGMLYCVNLAQGGYVYHFNRTNNLWDQFTGTGFTALANGGTMNIWAIGPISGGVNLYRLPDQGLQVTTTITGNASCNLPNCPSANHKPHVVSCFSGKHTGTCATQYGNWAPYQSNVLFTGSDTSFDPFSCLEGDTINCTISVNDAMDCTVGGNNFFNANSPPFTLSNYLEDCISYFKKVATPPIGSCVKHAPFGTYYCDYPVSVWCSNTSNPDFKVSLINDLYVPDPVIYGWVTPITQVCFRWPWSYNADGTKKWYHVPSVPGSSEIGQDDMIEITSGLPPQVCTYNP